MPVTEILILRHGHRLPWTLNPATGHYASSQPFPTGLPADPPLASSGTRQARELGLYLKESLGELAVQGRLRIYSSPFYRCLETLKPTVEALEETISTESPMKNNLRVRAEKGIGEWFGLAWFIQPKPDQPERLRKDFFPWIDDKYESKLTPPDHGEKIASLHERVAYVLAKLIQDVDHEYTQNGNGDLEVTLLLSSHAAMVVAAGRALTGRLPDDYNTSEFMCFTGGISKFVRKRLPAEDEAYHNDDWRNGAGIAGGWHCVLNSDCSHLSQGEENGWRFSGDEDFASKEAASAFGIKVADGNIRQ